MFIVEFTYNKSIIDSSIDDIEALLKEHQDFLDTHYASKIFFCSGKKVPNSGGIILANCENQKELEKIMDQDPFSKNGLSSYSIIEFTASTPIFSEFDVKKLV
jgi:uncharacterized protein YciI